VTSRSRLRRIIGPDPLGKTSYPSCACCQASLTAADRGHGCVENSLACGANVTVRLVGSC
jgi:hypothetical protein